MTRVDIMNNFVAARGYTSYLEIGVSRGESLRGVKCRTKVGVDPDPRSAATVVKTSDDFFTGNRDTFDIVFIDGLHTSGQAWRDIRNSLAAIRPDGVVVLHDCLPPTPHAASPDPHGGEWCGDVYRAVAWYFSMSPYLCYTIDADYGVGVIDTRHAARGFRAFPGDKMLDLTYDDFVKGRESIMHVVSPDAAASLCSGSGVERIEGVTA